MLNRKDALHATAVNWASQQRPTVITTEFVLLEVANFFKQPKDRGNFTRFIEALQKDPATIIVPCDSTWFQKGLDRFASRHDKEWSLTDCISFVVMDENGLVEALTDDHHFEQAGFTNLL